MTKRLISTAALTMGVQAIRLVGNLALVPVALHQLGHGGYAAFSVAMAYVSTGTLLESFLTPVLRNQLAAANTANSDVNREEVESVLDSSLKATAIGAGAALVGYQFLGAIGRDTSALVVACIFAALIVVASGFVEADFAARDDLFRLRAVELGFTGIGLAATYVALLTRPSTQDTLAILAASTGLGRLFAYYACSTRRKRRINVRLAVSFFQRHSLAGSTFAMGQLCLLANSVLPITLLAYFVPATVVSTYSVAQRVIAAPSHLLSSTFNTFWPAITRALLLKDYSWVRKTVVKMVVLILIGTIASCVLIGVFGSSAIRAWTNGAIQPPGLLLIGFVVLAGAQTTQSWLSIVFNAAGQFAESTRIYIALGIVQTAVVVFALLVAGPVAMVFGMAVTVLLVGVGGLTAGVLRIAR